MRSLGSILERSIVEGGGCFFDFFPRRFVFILDFSPCRFVFILTMMMMVIDSWISLRIVAPGDELRSDEMSSPEKKGWRREKCRAETSCCHRAMKQYCTSKKIFTNSKSDNKIESSL
jgi:hypothetical protein